MSARPEKACDQSEATGHIWPIRGHDVSDTGGGLPNSKLGRWASIRRPVGGLREPIRGRYPGHVITLDQSEAMGPPREPAAQGHAKPTPSWQWQPGGNAFTVILHWPRQLIYLKCQKARTQMLPVQSWSVCSFPPPPELCVSCLIMFKSNCVPFHNFQCLN